MPSASSSPAASPAASSAAAHSTQTWNSHDEHEELLAENQRLREEVRKLSRLRTEEMERAVEPELSNHVGARAEFTTEVYFWRHDVDHIPPVLPCLRLIDDLGEVVPGAAAAVPEIADEEALMIQKTMVRQSEFDKIFNEAQRQGRVAFYLTSRGEEACAVASAAALGDADWILPQYREMGAALWRGMTFEQIANQCTANAADGGKGRQLGLHIGDKSKHYLYVKSPLGTHLPQAAGAAYLSRLLKEERVAIAYFGEGTSSEGDTPSGFNIAAVHGCPTLFFCRNNGYAISTNARDQYRSDGVGPRGPAYGMPTLRVDGNDVLAVYAATAEARRIAIAEGTPVLLEAMTYRIGAHSTSDDDTKYRTPESPEPGWDSERAYWEARSPIIRFGRYLATKGLWSADQEDQERRAARKHAIKALNDAERVGKPEPYTLFTDVWDEMPPALAAQRAQLRSHLTQYREHYDVSDESIERL